MKIGKALAPVAIAAVLAASGYAVWVYLDDQEAEARIERIATTFIPRLLQSAEEPPTLPEARPLTPATGSQPPALQLDTPAALAPPVGPQPASAPTPASEPAPNLPPPEAPEPPPLPPLRAREALISLPTPPTSASDVSLIFRHYSGAGRSDPASAPAPQEPASAEPTQDKGSPVTPAPVSPTPAEAQTVHGEAHLDSGTCFIEDLLAQDAAGTPDRAAD